MPVAGISVRFLQVFKKQVRSTVNNQERDLVGSISIVRKRSLSNLGLLWRQAADTTGSAVSYSLSLA